MHTAIVIAAVAIVIAAVLYLRRHKAAEAKLAADAATLKTAAETEAKKIEADVADEVTKAEEAL